MNTYILEYIWKGMYLLGPGLKQIKLKMMLRTAAVLC